MPYELFGHVSYSLQAISYLVRDILLLRIVAICASIAEISYDFLIADHPLWVGILWNGCFIIINAGQILYALVERGQLKFQPDEMELYETVFHRFSLLEYKKLLRIGEWQNLPPQVVISQEGEDIDSVILIYNGLVSVQKAGKEVAQLKDGNIIGEMSFLQGGAATATTKTLAPTRVLKWKKTELRALLDRNPTMGLAMQSVFNAELIYKLVKKDYERRLERQR
ncbi:MAG: cyclic nucleotide-binding domain-containing protein [Pseudanabaenaceae cyanobacterium]